MKKPDIAGVCMALLCLLFTSELVSQTSANEGNRVRILTFNILHGETLKGDFDLDFIARPESPTQTELFSKWTASDPDFSPTFP